MVLELDLLGTVIERGEKATHNHIPSRQEVEAVNKVVHTYVAKHKLLLYGGTAIDRVLIYKIGEGIYGPNKLPDYDLISPNNVENAMELANILSDYKYPYVAVNQAQHGNTMRVKVNFASEASADITYYPLVVYNHIPYMEIEGIRYVSPEYMRIDFYKSFTNPNNYYRWSTKDEYMRYRKLVEAYPLPRVKITYKNQSKSTMYQIREIYNLLSSYDLIWTGVVAFNRFAKIMDTEQIPINYLEAYIQNASNVIQSIIDVLGDDYKVITFAPLLDHYPAINMIVYKKRPLLCLYDQPENCIPIVTISKQQFVSFHQLLLFLHIKILQSTLWNDSYYKNLSKNMLYRLTHERIVYLDKHNLVGIEKGKPLSIFDFDYKNLPVSEEKQKNIECYYHYADQFRYYPTVKGQ